MNKAIAATFIPALFVLAVGVAHAQTAADAATSASSDCVPSQTDLARIQTVENDPTLTVAQELNQELALRRQLLDQVLSCAVNDAQALQTDLSGIATPDGGSTIQNLLNGKITDALNFYNLEASQVANAGIRGTESIAKDTLSWRTSNYIPIKEDVDDFALWSANQELFSTAENRLTQTQRVVAFIESAAPNSGLQSSLDAARSSLADAESQDTAAENSLSELQPPDNSLALIQRSLQSLADTYQKFTDLNTLIQTLLPTTTNQ